MSEPTPPLRVGDRSSVLRTFSPEEVRSFASMSGDLGVQHTTEDPRGRLMVHGLLVASLPTQVGGRLNFLARELTFEFLRPVWTGTPIRCEVTLTKLEPSPSGTRLECTWRCTDPDGIEVMRGHGRGLVPRARSPP